MNKYESVCILAPNFTNKEIGETIVKIQNKIKEFSNKTIKIENLGKKKLAYEVKQNKEGIYLVINFECDAECIRELERFYRITDEVIKFITIRNDD